MALVFGPSRGPCIATILPTLLGFGGIDTIILSTSTKQTKAFYPNQKLAVEYPYDIKNTFKTKYSKYKWNMRTSPPTCKHGITAKY